LEAALVEPVSLTKRGKDKLVILTAAQYRKLIGRSHTQAYGLLDAPEDIHQELMTGIEDIIGTDNA
ncbi:prevent-host-death protein, partial [Rhizobium leguminosarum]|nr:prevent-host-death protein [Rhizobium leguminosarum]